MTGQELREKRKALGLTQADFAKEVGVERKTIIGLEKLNIIEGPKSTLLYNYFNSRKNEDIYTQGLDQFSIDQIIVYLINHKEDLKNSKIYEMFKKDLILDEAELLADEKVKEAAELIRKELSKE